MLWILPMIFLTLVYTQIKIVNKRIIQKINFFSKMKKTKIDSGNFFFLKVFKIAYKMKIIIHDNINYKYYIKIFE